MLYTIKKGEHSSRHGIAAHWGSKPMKVKFTLMGDCSYDLLVPDDWAINKLCGFSMGYHHWYSVRCGWRPTGTPGIIALFFYLYSAGKRTEHLFANVRIMKEYTLEMSLSGGRVNFSLSGNGQTAEKSIAYKKPWIRAGYRLYPYIGGVLPARWDTHIQLEFL